MGSMTTKMPCPESAISCRPFRANYILLFGKFVFMRKRKYVMAVVAQTTFSGTGTPDISRSLEGRAAGVSVQNVSGTFGTAPKIRIRGATSIYGSSKPLWVVDGVIMEDVASVSSDALASGYNL